MKKSKLPAAWLPALLCMAIHTHAQRPESIYAHKAVQEKLKTQQAIRPIKQAPANALPQNSLSARTALLLSACPTCQTIPFTTWSPNNSYRSIYGSDSVWLKTYTYTVQDPYWSGGFLNYEAGCVNFTHYADTSWGDMSYWDGFTVSKTNTFPCPISCANSCGGLESQFSSITGGGQGGSSDPYTVAYDGYNEFYFQAKHTTLKLGSASPVCGAYFTNNAYAYKSMKCGDDFADAFTYGDYFRLDIKGVLNGSTTGTVSYKLADFTNVGNAYIVNAWKWVNLTALGTVDSLVFSLVTTDAGVNGPNTPMYFCMDGLKIGTDPSCGSCAVTDTAQSWFLTGNGLRTTASTSFSATTSASTETLTLRVTPNPATAQITVYAQQGYHLQILDASGNKRYTKKLTAATETVNIAAFRPGIYSVIVSDGATSKATSFIKQ